LRIYDFDHSVKNYVEYSNFNFEYFLNQDQSDDFYKIYFNNVENPYLDIYRIFKIIFNILYNNFQDKYRISDEISYKKIIKNIYLLCQLLNVNNDYMTDNIDEFETIFIKLFRNNFNDIIPYNKKEIAIYNRIYIYYSGFCYDIDLKSVTHDIVLIGNPHLIFDDQYYDNYYNYLQRGDDTFIPSPNEMKTPDEYLKPNNPLDEIKLRNGSVIDAFDFTNIETGKTTSPGNIPIPIGIVNNNN